MGKGHKHISASLPSSEMEGNGWVIYKNGAVAPPPLLFFWLYVSIYPYTYANGFFFIYIALFPFYSCRCHYQEIASPNLKPYCSPIQNQQSRCIPDLYLRSVLFYILHSSLKTQQANWTRSLSICNHKDVRERE